jgi:hypothetical protein
MVGDYMLIIPKLRKMGQEDCEFEEYTGLHSESLSQLLLPYNKDYFGNKQ